MDTTGGLDSKEKSDPDGSQSSTQEPLQIQPPDSHSGAMAQS